MTNRILGKLFVTNKKKIAGQHSYKMKIKNPHLPRPQLGEGGVTYSDLPSGSLKGAMVLSKIKEDPVMIVQTINLVREVLVQQ
jgi:hypothetical protein